MTAATVSAVIATYNRPDYVTRAVASCLEQSFSCHEIIVVDDGSTDDTAQALAQYSTRIRLVRQPNRGIAAARNIGIQRAIGDYIAFLDDDDIWVPQKLERQVDALLRAPGAAVAFSDFAFVPAPGSGSQPPRAPNRWKPSNVFTALLMGNWLSTSTILVRRDCLLTAGGFDEDLRTCEDWDLWLQLAAHYDWVHVPEELTLMLWHDQSISRNLDVMIDTTWKVLRKQFAVPGAVRLPRRLRRQAYSAAHYRVAMYYITGGQYARAAWEMVLGLSTAPERLLLEPRKVGLLLSSLKGRGHRRASAPVVGVQQDRK